MNMDREGPMRPCTMQLSRLIAVAALVGVGVDLRAQSSDFDSVKIQADANERTLSEAERTRLQSAQRALLDRAVPDCATPTPQLEPFVIVAQLDAAGTIKRTWRRGSTPLAVCVERQLRGKTLPAPQDAPFLISFELSFAP